MGKDESMDLIFSVSVIGLEVRHSLPCTVGTRSEPAQSPSIELAAYLCLQLH